MTYRKKVKFCGFTQKEDLEYAELLGIDAIGLVFYPPSPRYITPEKAVEITREVSAFTTIIALVVNMPLIELQSLVNTVDFDVIQFHGNETPECCQYLAQTVKKRWIKALRINSQQHTKDNVITLIDDYYKAGASAIILDAYNKNAYGGTGDQFDWSIIPDNVSVPLILAGGLTAENINKTRELPVVGFDVSGGIESEKGIKNKLKMATFLDNI